MPLLKSGVEIEAWLVQLQLGGACVSGHIADNAANVLSLATCSCAPSCYLNIHDNSFCVAPFVIIHTPLRHRDNVLFQPVIC